MDPSEWLKCPSGSSKLIFERWLEGPGVSLLPQSDTDVGSRQGEKIALISGYTMDNFTNHSLAPEVQQTVTPFPGSWLSFLIRKMVGKERYTPPQEQREISGNSSRRYSNNEWESSLLEHSVIRSAKVESPPIRIEGIDISRLSNVPIINIFWKLIKRQSSLKHCLVKQYACMMRWSR